VCVTLLMCAFQRRLVYFPMREYATTPDAVGLPYEAVAFAAADGVKLSGWFVPAEKPRGVVLFCHGNAGNISHRVETMRLHRELGLSSFHFDYRGYGQSEGTPSEQGTYRDAEAAWRYLTEGRKVPAEQIVLHGRSLGGSIAAWLARERPAKALIAESTFTSIPDVAARVYWFLPVRLMARYHYETKAAVPRVQCPVLIVHSAQDEIVPFSHGRQLYELAPAPKTFLEIHGGHNDGWEESREVYARGLDDFLTSCLGPRAARPETRP
jgi:fermentation-respiration switch protein FrsA (DUF1100 family)